eukprot:TRINITY_DN6208_c0_g1_i6.p1 TRINITY_DN6208_c0_g1~~TRINITY_DN6208_c0_g1_i6.p1  ORF type:complete len:1328 (-),score=244.96 TRINITY_DN6208_c0_g1_i6:365-4240(-)
MAARVLDLEIVKAMTQAVASSGSGDTMKRSGATLLSISLFDLHSNLLKVENLEDPILLKIADNVSDDAVCVFWNETLGEWSEEGVTRQRTDGSSELLCATTHLSCFAGVVKQIGKTLQCSNAVFLFSQEAMDNLGRGGWESTSACVAIWFTMGGAVLWLLWAASLDYRDSLLLNLDEHRATLTHARRISCLSEAPEESSGSWLGWPKFVAGIALEISMMLIESSVGRFKALMKAIIEAPQAPQVLVETAAVEAQSITVGINSESVYTIRRLGEASSVMTQHGIYALSHKVATVKNLHQKGDEALMSFLDRSLAFKFARLCVAFNPVMAMMTISLFQSHLERAWLFVVRLAGAAAANAFFFTSTSIPKNGPNCGEPDEYPWTGRLVVGFANTLLSDGIMYFLVSLRGEHYPELALLDGIEIPLDKMRRRMRAAKVRTFIFWMLLLSYTGAGIYASLAFNATVSEKDQADWLVACMFTLLDLLVIECVVGALIISLLVGLAMWCRSGMKEAVQLNRGFSRALTRLDEFANLASRLTGIVSADPRGRVWERRSSGSSLTTRDTESRRIMASQQSLQRAIDLLEEGAGEDFSKRSVHARSSTCLVSAAAILEDEPDLQLAWSQDDLPQPSSPGTNPQLQQHSMTSILSNGSVAQSIAQVRSAMTRARRGLERESTDNPERGASKRSVHPSCTVVAPRPPDDHEPELHLEQGQLSSISFQQRPSSSGMGEDQQTKQHSMFSVTSNDAAWSASSSCASSSGVYRMSVQDRHGHEAQLIDHMEEGACEDSPTVATQKAFPLNILGASKRPAPPSSTLVAAPPGDGEEFDPQVEQGWLSRPSSLQKQPRSSGMDEDQQVKQRILPGVISNDALQRVASASGVYRATERARHGHEARSSDNSEEGAYTDSSKPETQRAFPLDASRWLLPPSSALVAAPPQDEQELELHLEQGQLSSSSFQQWPSSSGMGEDQAKRHGLSGMTSNDAAWSSSPLGASSSGVYRMSTQASHGHGSAIVVAPREDGEEPELQLEQGQLSQQHEAQPGEDNLGEGGSRREADTQEIPQPPRRKKRKPPLWPCKWGQSALVGADADAEPELQSGQGLLISSSLRRQPISTSIAEDPQLQQHTVIGVRSNDAARNSPSVAACTASDGTIQQQRHYPAEALSSMRFNDGRGTIQQQTQQHLTGVTSNDAAPNVPLAAACAQDRRVTIQQHEAQVAEHFEEEGCLKKKAQTQEAPGRKGRSFSGEWDAEGNAAKPASMQKSPIHTSVPVARFALPDAVPIPPPRKRGRKKQAQNSVAV